METTPQKQVRLVMPASLYEDVKRLCNGNPTRFILQAVREHVRHVDSQRLEEELADSYRTRADEHWCWAKSVEPLYGEVAVSAAPVAWDSSSPPR